MSDELTVNVENISVPGVSELEIQGPGNSSIKISGEVTLKLKGAHTITIDGKDNILHINSISASGIKTDDTRKIERKEIVVDKPEVGKGDDPEKQVHVNDDKKAMRYLTELSAKEEFVEHARDVLKNPAEYDTEILDQLPGIICELSYDGTVLYVNDFVKEIAGYTPAEIIGKNLCDAFFESGDRNEVFRIFKRLKSAKVNSFDFPVNLKSGEKRTFAWSCINRFNPDLKLQTITLLGFDITDRIKLEESLRIKALTDSLTGLYNRQGFITFSEQFLLLANRTKKGSLLLFIDVDGMKHINDTFGHVEGDRALIDTGRILKETFRESDVIGRLGGDEFVALLINAPKESSQVIIKNIKRNIELYNSLHKRPYKLSVSFGLIPYNPENPVTIDKLLEKADAEMYKQKMGKGRRYL